MSRLAGQAVASVFGGENQFLIVSGPVATTSATPITYLLFTTTSLPAGTYYADSFFVIEGSAASTNISAKLLIDGAGNPGYTGPDALLQTNVISGRFILSGATATVFTAGTHDYELEFAKPAGSGTVTALNANVVMWRFA